MKNRFLFFSFLLLAANALSAQSAYNNLVIFCDEGDSFHVLLNGEQQTQSPKSNVKITNLSSNSYVAKIVFQDNTLPSITKTIYFNTDQKTEQTYRIRKGKAKKGKPAAYEMKFFTQDVNPNNNVAANQTLVVYGTPANTNTSTTTTTVNNNSTTAAPSTTTTTYSTTTTTSSVGTPTNNGGSANVTINANATDPNVYSNTTTTNTNTNNTASTTTTTTNGSASANVSINANDNGATINMSGYENYGTPNNPNTTTTNGSASVSVTVNPNGMSINMSGTGDPNVYSDPNVYTNTTTTNTTNTNTNTNTNFGNNNPTLVTGNTNTTNTTNSGTTVTTTTVTTTTNGGTGTGVGSSNTNVVNSNTNNTTTYYVSNNPNCRATNGIFTDADFTRLKQSVEKQDFDNGKISVVKQALRNRCISADQVGKIMELLDHDSNRLELAKTAYPQCHDQENYYQVNDAFDFSSNADALTKFTEGK